MSSPFAARRKARVIAHAEGEDNDLGQAENLELKDKKDSAARADPLPLSRALSRTRKTKSSRISFGPGGTSMTEEDDQATSLFTPKKSNLSRQAIEKNAVRKSLGASLASDSIPFRQTDDRPSYSAEYLSELKSSTPSTPKDLKPTSSADTEESKAIDLQAKFGSNLSVYENPVIPTDAEIREKKERRARLAKEEEYINVHGSDESDDDRNVISLRPRKDHPETRLVHDDEDIAEGFDDYVDDARIALGQNGERELRRKQKSEMETLINEAEGGSSSDETDDSEVERRQAYEAAQTRAGMDGLQKNDDYNQLQRPRTPPKITPIPTLNGCLEKLQASLTKMQYEKMQRARKLEEVRKEKLEMAEREVEIQRLLREAGENYDKLRSQIGGELAAATNGHMILENGTTMTAERGLENL
ncbi:MAG: hypothetical protein LQ338_002529 [Usnochroma carphineum]|nr:MAG: hypothetical protein LQ338_002529 [Usnochroma carphineum]